MPRRFALVVLAVATPGIAQAQSRDALSSFPRSTAVGVTARPLEPLCDGTEIRRLEIQREIGKGMIYTALAVGLLGALAAHSHPGHGVPIVLTAGALGFGGVAVAGSAYPGDSFWQVTLARAQRGLTTPDDVRSCLHDPDGTSVTSTEEQWIYRARPSAIIRMGHVSSDVQFTFKNGVLSDVRRTERGADLAQR